MPVSSQTIWSGSTLRSRWRLLMASMVRDRSRDRHFASNSATRSRTVPPSASSNSNIAAATGHPPRRPARVDQPSHLANKARRRGNPAGACIAGATTWASASFVASSRSSSWSCSLDRKWANRPLLDIWAFVARRPRVRPAKPSALRVSRPSDSSLERVGVRFGSCL